MPSPDGGAEPLACPRCGRPHPADARLCESCGMPLVHAQGAELEATDPAHEQARKIQPRYARGALQRVTVASNLAEAELIKGVLLEQGIPSLIRRTAGFDVPDFLAAGPRDVLVPEAGVEAARSLLATVEAEFAATAGPAEELYPEDVAAADDDPETALPPPGRRRSLELRIAAFALAFLLAFGAAAGAIIALAR